MIKRIFFVSTILTSFLQFSNCGLMPKTDDASKDGQARGYLSDQGRFRVELNWTKGPTANEWNEVELKFFTSGSKTPERPIEFLKFEPSQKNGEGFSLVEVDEFEVERQTVDVKEIWFPSAGDWKIEIRARVDGFVDSAFVSVKDVIDVRAPQDNSDQIELGLVSDKEEWRCELEWLEGPYSEQTIQAKLTFFDLDSKPLASSLEVLEFIPTMPSMNHGTVMDEQTYTANGNQVLVDGIYLIMGGDWLIEVKARVDGRIDSVFFDLNDVEPR